MASSPAHTRLASPGGAVTGAAKATWSTDMFECCASPGGCRRCCYVTWCVHCAAGDVAKGVRGSYCIDCCLVLALGCHCFVWSATRQALKQALGLQDGSGCCGDGVKFIFCAPCMICQELNELDRQRHNQSLGDTSIMPQSMV